MVNVNSLEIEFPIQVDQHVFETGWFRHLIGEFGWNHILL